MQCPICFEHFEFFNIESHTIYCTINSIKDNNVKISECPICFNHFEFLEIKSHVIDCCNAYELNFFPYVSPELSKSQKKAYKYCKSKAKIHSDQTKGLVLIRFLKHNYSEEDMYTTINHIKNNVKVTINISIKVVLEKMLNETHVRNGFEIGRFRNADSNNNLKSGRFIWETNLFNQEYDKSEAFERVKYGAINIFNEPGIRACSGYGESFFELKDEVKDRVTFVYGDSSAQMLHICTFKYCEQLLIHPGDVHFKAIVNYAINDFHQVNQHLTYIEAQIHGPVRLNTDIDKFCIKQSVFDKLCDQDKNNIKVFCKKNNINFIILKID